MALNRPITNVQTSANFGRRVTLCGQTRNL
jgi:hypothetical protein